MAPTGYSCNVREEIPKLQRRSISCANELQIRPCYNTFPIRMSLRNRLSSPSHLTSLIHQVRTKFICHPRNKSHWPAKQIKLANRAKSFPIRSVQVFTIGREVSTQCSTVQYSPMEFHRAEICPWNLNPRAPCRPCLVSHVRSSQVCSDRLCPCEGRALHCTEIRCMHLQGTIEGLEARVVCRGITNPHLHFLCSMQCKQLPES